MEEWRFACDAMLGTLARWLRFAGFDVFFAPHLADAQLAQRARSEGRWLLTQDRKLAAAAGPRVLLLRGASVSQQVAELRQRLGVAADPQRFFTRCSRCNGVLAEVAAQEVAGEVPPYVAAHAPRFVRCRGCGRVYWPGSHLPRIEATLRRLFADPLPHEG